MMKHNVIKYGAGIIFRSLEVDEKVLPYLSRNEFIIYSRNGELPSTKEYCGTENSLLAMQPYLIPLILGLRINLESFVYLYTFSVNELLDCINRKVPKLQETVVKTVNTKFVDTDFVINSVSMVSDLGTQFVLGYKNEIDEFSKISTLKSISISSGKKVTDTFIYPNNQIGMEDYLNLLTFTNNKNLYRLAVMDTL